MDPRPGNSDCKGKLRDNGDCMRKDPQDPLIFPLYHYFRAPPKIILSLLRPRTLHPLHSAFSKA